jgi:hypothetical protein
MGANTPPLPQAPIFLDQLLATQNALMQRLVANDERRESREQQQQPCQHQQHEATYSNFLATHPHVFTEATDLPVADSWLRTTEAKFGLLRYSEM